MSRAVAPTTKAGIPLDLPNALCEAVCTRSAPALPINPVSWPAIAPAPRRRHALRWIMERAVGIITGREWLCAIGRGLLHVGSR